MISTLRRRLADPSLVAQLYALAAGAQLDALRCRVTGGLGQGGGHPKGQRQRAEMLQQATGGEGQAVHAESVARTG